MIITTTDEIRMYLPTSVYSGAESLLAIMDDTEENVLVPILGRELYGKVCEAYESAVEEYGGVTSALIGKENLTPEIRLIRMCQLPVVYLTLANSSGILTVSLNEGGGLNQVYTDGYDKADDAAVTRFERDAFFKGRRGIDRLLLFLEEDARSEEPRFAELWRKSRYFYEKGNLLFTTASCMNNYIDINESREKFISMIPDIRYCQESYLSPEIGEEFMDAMIGWCTHRIDVSDIEHDKDRLPDVWDKAIDRLRISLALFVESRRPEKQRKYSENEAYLSLEKAKKYISSHQEYFGLYIKTSPLYTPPPEKKPSVETPGKDRYDYNDPDNALFVLFPGGLNRH